jgi:hypothetical protein
MIPPLILHNELCSVSSFAIELSGLEVWAACNPKIRLGCKQRLMAQHHRWLEGSKPEWDELEPAGQNGLLVAGVWFMADLPLE